jgi:hypothetical protein
MNKLPFLSIGLVNTFPRKLDAYKDTGVFYVVILKEKNWGSPVQLVENQPVKRRLGGWYEMAANLGPS